jgi:transposase
MRTVRAELCCARPCWSGRGSPFGTSVSSLATYFRYTHAISYERLVGEVVHLEISEGALASLFERIKMHLEGTTTAILERLRRSHLMCSDETSARVKGRNQWEGVFQNDEVGLQVIRPSRGALGIADTMGTHRPQVGDRPVQFTKTSPRPPLARLFGPSTPRLPVCD